MSAALEKVRDVQVRSVQVRFAQVRFVQVRDVPFGEGCVDFLNVFRKLKALNYRGTFLIEMWTEKADEPVQEIINARRWIEAKMAEAGWSN